MSNILRYKSIVAVCLCFIFVFSFFALTFQRSEAIATIPLVAVPIIKLLIASGVTFLSVDAMLEVYNRMKGTDYYNTLTGNILNVLDDLSEDLVSSWLFHDWAMQQPDPPGSGWPEWPELLLGTLCLEIVKSDNFFQDFLNWFNWFKDDIEDDIMFNIDDEFVSVDNYTYGGTGKEIYYISLNFYSLEPFKKSLYVDGHGGTVFYPGRNVNIPYKQNKCFLSLTDGYSDWRYVNAEYFSSFFQVDVTGGGSPIYLLRFRPAYMSEYSVYSPSVPLEDVLNPTVPVEFPNIFINEDDNFQNDEKEKIEIYVPIPNEIVTYDPDTGLDLDFDTEISIEEFTELMTPYVGSTWEDIQQDKPIPSKVPTDVPYPEDPVVPDPVVPSAPVPDEDDLPPDADEGDDPFTGADEGKTIDWDPLKGIGLHKKFPFCIPWDIYDSFRVFNVEGEAPCWKVEFLHDTEFTIDFSIFEPWAVIVRWGILILFNLGLILVTRNLIRG